MRKVAVVAAIIALLPASLGFGPPTLIESPQALAPLYADQIPMIQSFQPPLLTAASASLADARSGQLLYGRDASARRAMASVTKIMTALLALERGRLDERVVITVDSMRMIDSSVMGLRPGEEMTLRDLLYGLLLPSGNDAALAIAEHIGGTVSNFVALMNQRAAELMLADTHFANPHGLDDPNHFSSAADLASLARIAKANPAFAKIVGAKQYTVLAKLATYELRNTNLLLWDYPGVDGVKTGTTDNAGQCLVVSAQENGASVLTVVLGSTERFSDTKKLLDFYRASFRCQSLGLAPDAFQVLPPGPADVQPGQQSEASVAPSLSEVVWDCRPTWQVRWLRSVLTWEDGAVDPQSGQAAFYFADALVGQAAVAR